MTHNMNIEQAKLLLTRFYEGKTMPAEERLLAEFFRSDDVPAEFNTDKQLFMQLSEIADTPMPDDIAEQIKTFVGNLTDNDNTTQIETTAKRRTGFSFRMHTPPKMWYRVAATVAILLAIGGGVLHHQRTYAPDPFRDTCATPEEAAAQIQRANSMIAKATEQCMVPTSKALQKADATKQVINQYINF